MTTTEEERASNEPLCNQHHNIPGSRGGSDEEVNLSTVHVSRHNNFHRTWGANRIPCYLTRLMALHSIGYDGKTIDPESLNALFQITTMSDWHRIYVQEALASITTPKAGKITEKVARYSRTHLTEEHLYLQNALNALQNGGMLPSEDSHLLGPFLRFFNTTDPQEALRTLYTEKFDGHLSWVRPMQGDARQHILNVLSQPAVLYDERSKDDLIEVLQNQDGYISRHLSEWNALAEENGGKRSYKRRPAS